MYDNITVIGDGGMGTVCAMLLCNKGVKVTMWGHDASMLAEISAKRENVFFLPGYKLPESLLFESSDAKAMSGADLLVSAVPCQFVRSVWCRLKGHVPAGVAIVSVTKGIEHGTLFRPTEILRDVMGDCHSYGTLSGPTIADELAQQKPATACVASVDAEFAQSVQKLFNSEYFRVYTNSDIIGVELSGAVKNVIAIAAGIVDGVKGGDNAKAALLTRGLAEIKRLGLAMGAKEKTFSGLSGLGDLVTTCVSPHGRNRSFGERIGQGMSAADALGATKSVVEGAATCAGVLELARRYDIEMPITAAINAVITEGKSVQSAIRELMSRELKAE